MNISFETEFEVTDDAVIKYTPVPGLGENTYKSEVVMTKEVFQECYKKWIKPEQKTGHWIKTIGENGITSAVRCSECGFEDNRYMLFRYCPNCIAKMVETQESEDMR